MPSLRAIAVVSLAMLGATAGSARAATIEVIDPSHDNYIVRVTGDPGETSRLVVEPVTDALLDHEGWLFTDEENELHSNACFDTAQPSGGSTVYCRGMHDPVWDIDLGDADDTLHIMGGYTSPADEPNINGGEGDDRLVSVTRPNNFQHHHLGGGPGNDTLIGSDERSTLTGGPGNDHLDTGAGWEQDYYPEVADGGEGDDVIHGGPHGDKLSGGLGDDTLVGGGGDDDMTGGTGGDGLSGGDGYDRVRYPRLRTQPGVTITIDGRADDGSIEDKRLDNVRRDVEFVHATDSPDRLVGNELSNGFQANDGVDVILGGDGPDAIWAGAADDVDVDGGPGQDLLYGQTGRDRLTGGEDDDELLGEEGDDELIGGAGNDVHRGGDGSDHASYADRDTGVVAALDGRAGHGAPGEDDQIDADVEGLTGGEGGDRLVGDESDNVLAGGGGTDVLEAGDGHDRIDPGAGEHDEVHAGPGVDVADYSGRRDPVDVSLDGAANDGEVGEQDNVLETERVWGGFGDDHLTGNAEWNKLEGGDGADTLDGGPGPDVLAGGEGGHDTVTYASRTAPVTADLRAADGSSGEREEFDVLEADIEDAVGGMRGSTLIGDRGPNVLTGGAGRDVIDGGGGRDALHGGWGDDTLAGGPGLAADHLDGGPGSDTASYADRTVNVRVDLDGTDDDGQPGENDALESIANVVGGSGNDTLAGDDQANELSGGPGADEISGAGGTFDRIDGDGGNDTLRGGAGDDAVDGGADNDVLDDDGGAESSDTMVGGPGLDTASYARRDQAVTVDTDGAPDDGAAGEGDRVAADVERLVGGSGGDVLSGGTGGALELFGGHGDDAFVGRSAADAFHGGPGTDTADYRSSPVNVVADIDGVADDGPDADADGDADIGANVNLDVENLQGGAQADRLRGSAEENVLSGNGGDDSLDGGPGFDPDALLGGTGTDTADFSRRTSRLTITLDGLANDGAELNPLVDGAEERDAVGPGIERVRGGTGDDWLIGTSGAQELFGGGGADVLDGGPGADFLDGGTDGSGGDTASYMHRTIAVVADLGGAGDDGTDANGDGVAEEGDRIAATVEHLVGGAGADRLTGDGRANDLEGLGGGDRLDGGAGDDTLEPGRHLDRNRDGDADVPSGGGADALVGGSGRDSVSYRNRSNPVIVDLDGSADDGEDTNGNGIADEGDNAGATLEDVVGTLRPDRITGNAAGNRLDGVDGADRLSGLGGDDELLVDEGLARMDGGTGADRLSGRGIADYSARSVGVVVKLDGFANDGTDANGDGVAEEGDDVEPGVARVDGGAGGDRLTGTASFEQLAGNGGADFLFGLAGDDWLFGGFGADVLDGGTGRDTAIYAERTAPLAIDIDGTADDGTDADGDGVAEEGDNVRLSVEDVAGGTGADRIRGSSAANVLVGGPGADLLTGSGGTDTLRGLAGADELRAAGDGAADLLECGTEVDRALADIPPDTVDPDCEQLTRSTP